MHEERVEAGQIKATSDHKSVLIVDNLGTNVALIVYDADSRVGAVANIVLPESTLGVLDSDVLGQSGKYANKAVPALWNQYLELGGQKQNAMFKMAGGAQLFNFGGGGGNLLNIGARNAVAIRAALSRLGLVVHKADIGGNKGRQLRFLLNTGEIFIKHIGSNEHRL